MAKSRLDEPDWPESGSSSGWIEAWGDWYKPKTHPHVPAGEPELGVAEQWGRVICSMDCPICGQYKEVLTRRHAFYGDSYIDWGLVCDSCWPALEGMVGMGPDAEENVKSVLHYLKLRLNTNRRRKS